VGIVGPDKDNKEDMMSEQLASTTAPVVQLDMVLSHGTPAWTESA